MSSDNVKNDQSILTNKSNNIESLESLNEKIDYKKNSYSKDLKEPIISEDLLKPERNTRIKSLDSYGNVEGVGNVLNSIDSLVNNKQVSQTPSKTEIDKLVSITDDSTSILLTAPTMEDIIEDEIISEVEEDINGLIPPITNNTKHSKVNKSNNSDSTKERANDSASILTEEELSSKTNSQNQINSSKNDIESIKVEKNLKFAMDKELSFNYLDENEKLFDSFINKEALLKEYLEIRKKLEKYLLSFEHNKNLDSLAFNGYENLVNKSDYDDLQSSQSNNNPLNNSLSTSNFNISDKNIFSLLDKYFEKIIENEKINERYRKRMTELIEIKDKFIGRQRIRNNKLEFALKEALFFLEKPFDVNLVQSHFINTLLSNYKDNQAESQALNTSNPNSNTNSNSNSNSMTAQAKKYLKKINKKHDNKNSLNQNINPVLRISKEENELCMQFSINYLRQALDWIEKDVDIDGDYEKFKIKRYISVDKIPKIDESKSMIDEDEKYPNLSKPLSTDLSENNINVSYSKIKINYQKGPSTEELTNEINLDDIFDKPEFNDNKKYTLKKSNTFRREKNESIPQFSNFTKSKSVNSLFASQYSQSNIDFDQLVNMIDEIDNEENMAFNEINEEKNESSSIISQNSDKSNKSVHKNVPILITPLNADSEYNHSNREGSDSIKDIMSEKEPSETSSTNINRSITNMSTCKRSLSLNAKEAKIMSAKLYNNLLKENNMINVMISLENENVRNDSSMNESNKNVENLPLPNSFTILSNYKCINNLNIEELQENFNEHFTENQLENNNTKFNFSINGENGLKLFKEILKGINQGGAEKINNLDKTNFVTSLEYNKQLKKIEALEKENNRLNYQLEKKTLEYDHEHMAKVMLDKELEDLTSQLFLQANKLVETECHKLEDTKVKLKELNDKYNAVKIQLEKRENELNALKKVMIKNEEKKISKRTKMFPKILNNNVNSSTVGNSIILLNNPPLEKLNINSVANSEELLSTSYNSNNSKLYSMDNNVSYISTDSYNVFASNILSTNKANSEAVVNVNSESNKVTKEINNLNTLNLDICSETIMDSNGRDEDDKVIHVNNNASIEEQSEEIKSWNLYSTKVIAIQNDKIFTYIDGGQFNEFQNYIRDSLIKVNNNKKKKNNIFCLPNTSFMKRCIEDEIYPCLFEHFSDQQSSSQSKRNSITKTHVNFKKKLQKALSCNGIIIIPFELLSKNGKLIKSTTPVTPKEKQNLDNSTSFSSSDEENGKDNETVNESNDSYSSKKIEYYLEYDFVHPLPLPPRKKCCLCMNYRDCHYHIIFKNIESKDKDGSLISPDSSKLINNINIIVNNNKLSNNQDNLTSSETNNKHTNNDKDSTISPTTNSNSLSNQMNKKNTNSNNDVSPVTSPTSKVVEDYTAKCYNINSDFLHQLRTENCFSFNEQFFLCPICRDKIVSVADLYSYLSSLESKLTGSSKGQSSILNMFKNVILLKRRIATAKLGALQFFEQNNDLFKDESLTALYDNSSEEWENYVKII
ncbi:hypothetical protein BCR36DRAFT_583594 [Piromyces finnis]|uniref:GDP/GTP exchange factor Sec2 N-terminal domain-containing protein n=1 Tax=Piromyces finnis TaxID=1754191 RepID=A0A1Y1V9S4_9FUNG|nr:hypothetical protein BCR36DRAFT_583594 [Piromyces finnis]|eukprot:ORX49982.1 hypothetical protein BCR36DRAFT_583594 [Piromyces finnis]